MLHGDIVTAARAKYNNMVSSDEYSKLDPKDIKILALTTKVTSLKRSGSANLANVEDLVADTEETRATKLQVWINGAL